jgi:shikimate dehydrogenase
MMKIDAKTKLCLLIGDPVEHSMSPAIHNAAFQKLGLNYVYLAFQVKDVKAAVSGLRGLSIRGASVTIPHKVSVMPHLDQIEDVARWIGSLNTIVNDDGVLKGYNSDASGALAALKDRGVRLAGKKVLMIGSGGAARSIAFAIAADKKAEEILILGIIEKEFKKLARDIRDKTGQRARAAMLTEKSLKDEMADAHVLIHCSPVGMYPRTNHTLIPKNLFRPEQKVMDIVYNPLETRLLKEARQAGCKTIPGIEMFLNQAVVQFELWTKKNAPKDLMKKILIKNLQA